MKSGTDAFCWVHGPRCGPQDRRMLDIGTGTG